MKIILGKVRPFLRHLTEAHPQVLIIAPSGMHVGRTAELLFIHQNTVRYRLGRFEKLTDTSLLDAEVLVELWWLLELSTMRL